MKTSDLVMEGFDPLTNKKNRVENLLALEDQATALSQSGADPASVTEFVNQGAKAVAANYPDIPEYTKAASAAGLYRQSRVTEDPQQTLSSLPF
jgi:hypothetical protein